jgi:hypothetical protein
MPAAISLITANFNTFKSIATDERRLCGSQSNTVSDGSWPVSDRHRRAAHPCRSSVSAHLALGHEAQAVGEICVSATVANDNVQWSRLLPRFINA